MTETGSPQSPAGPTRTNRLIHETSPYLLQHARNPVDWYPWGAEALARAKAENKPILLSIGYSSCHWCHVMERESFENEAIALLMNRHFVCIKVDREERPDLDDIYMAATQALNQGQGGWPMTVFLTPDQQPFFAGTYFPPTDRLGRPGFASLLRQLASLWESQREEIVAHAATLTEHLAQRTQAARGGSVGEAEIRAAVEELRAAFDPAYGGFSPAPKFPPAGSLALLLRAHQKTGDPELLAMVVKTLDGMAQGGMYDQIGGGFARYATDERWLVPHFEKMLYDNALLTKAYLEGYQVTGNAFYARIARETLDYILREMTGPEGGFFSATDADSEGEEGKFFVWTPAEVEAALGPEEAGKLCTYYDISEEGNWEGKSIPHTPRTPERVASRLGIPPAAFLESVAAGRAKLYEARRRRVPPGLDDKILTAWNGLMLGAMAEGARVLGEPRYFAAACRAADFLLGTMRRPDGGLFRTCRSGTAHLPAFLEDYAFLAEGLLDLYEAGGEARYLDEARRLAERVLQDFADPAGGFAETAHDHEPLIFRHRQGADTAIPSANATAAAVFARLSFHLDRPLWRETASLAIQAYARPMSQFPRGFAKALLATDFLLEGPIELALVGTREEAGYEALRAEVSRRFFPRRILAHHDPAAGPAPELPLLAGKGLVGGKAALYVCRNFACQAPITEPEWLDRALRRRPDAGPGATRTRLTSARAGRATPEGTAARAARFEAAGLAHGYAPLGKTGLTVSRLGFGGYRVDEDTPEHREALIAALAAGCSLIDTSTNYMDGQSESLVGSVLLELDRDGRLPREEAVVVSKIGYVQGQNLALVTEREKAGTPFPEMVKYMEGCWHCLHPAWLEDQLGRSLERLQLATLDVCLLHNPEYFLSDAKQRRERDLPAVRREFYRRLTEAFRYLEAQVAAGRIGCYGVSSNTAVNPADDPEATSLSRMLQAAHTAGGADHHFRVLEVPLNLLESGAATRPNTGPDGARTPLEVAAEAGLAVLVNRPLNAFGGDRLVRLADFPEIEEADAPPLPQALRQVADLEEEFRRSIAVHLQPGEGVPPPAEWFRWADQIRAMEDEIHGLDHWQQIESHMITPAVASLIPMLDEALGGEMGPVWTAWRDRYLPTLDQLLEAMALRAARSSQAMSNQVAAAVNPHLPLARRGETLSRKALWVIASTPGVTTVLLGMRHPDYVADGMEILRWAPLGDVKKVYEAVAAVRIG